MSTLPDKWWQDKTLLAAEVAKHRTLRKTADATGVGRTTIREWAKRHGVEGYADVRPALRLIEPGAEVSREEMLEAEVKELRSAIRKARSGDVAAERVAEIVTELVPAKAPQYLAPPAPNGDSGKTPHTFVLQWSDLHAAERVNSDAMNGLNEYDWDVMLERHALLQRAVLSFAKNRPYPIDALWILGLGDQLSGDIHDELKITNDRVLLDAALQLGLDAAEWVEAFVPYFPEIHIVGVGGNHPRTTVKPSYKNPHSNYDWLVYHLMKIRLAQYPSITVDVPRSAETVAEIGARPWRVLCFHGDGPRTTMPGVPWGGLVRYISNKAKTYAGAGQPLDFFACGHWHDPNVVRNLWVNGCVKGYDEFAMKRGLDFTPPMQLLHVLHPTRGLTETCWLNLDAEHDDAEAMPRLLAVA